ncbi:MAG: type II toxin-antitoxin system RelE/ParE family toxin [Devosia sp.]
MRFRLSPAAAADIEAIWDYTAQQWDRVQADRYVRAIEERIVGLAEGRIPARSAEDIRPAYFKCAAGSHMIYFRRDANELEIIRILHQSMDMETRLRGL